MAKVKPLVWEPKQVDISKIKATPKNYKIQTSLGRKRLQHSLSKFGIAGTVVLNVDLTLIDGNSRVEEMRKAGIKKMWVSMPNRKLTTQEFKEMSAMIDYAKAGQVDEESIQQDFGRTKDFFKDWSMQPSMQMKAALESMGSRTPIAKASKQLDFPDEKGKPVQKDLVMVQLFFTQKQEQEFRRIEDKFAPKLKVNNTTDFVLRSVKQLK